MNARPALSRKAVLFDLDDTIFDHQYARRSALAALQHAYPVLEGHTIRSLEAAHEQHLQTTFALLIAAKLTLEESRRERLRLFFAGCGTHLSSAQADLAEILYRRVYDANRRPVPGVLPLINALRARGVKVGVVTNGLPIEQNEKIRLCGLDEKLDALVMSGQLGVKKPDKAIFEHALAILAVAPTEAVVIGDSWHHDVLGARNAGIPAVWFNRYDEPYPEASTQDLVPTLTHLEPLDAILRLFSV